MHLPLRTRIVMTDLRTAEMIKYASNAFLATKISFINEIAVICEKLGADVRKWPMGMGFDRRIGAHFLNAGLGYGGSCFPKDVKALEHMALVHGSHPALLRAVIDINRDMRRWAVYNLRELLGGKLDGKRIGLLGLAFKPNTDDIREAPALEIARMLQNEGALVSGYDPGGYGAMWPASIRQHAPGRGPLRSGRRRRCAARLHRVERVQAARSAPATQV